MRKLALSRLLRSLTQIALAAVVVSGLTSGCDRGSDSRESATPADATPADESTSAMVTGDSPADTNAEASVKPGINDAWKSDDVAPLIDRLESETREVYAHRAAIADLAAPKPGSVVADVGSGSGFMTQELAQRVGPGGKVYAVDINQTLLDRVKTRVEAAGLTNVATVLTSDRAVDLPPASVDLMFICDTYHHFEFPKTMLASIRGVLKPGAELVIVDFEKIEGETEDWIMQHVRASKDEVARELSEAGFESVAEHDLPALQQNYVLRFRKPVE